MYFVVHLPRYSFRAHNPYGVLFLSTTPVALYHFDKKLRLKGVTVFYKVQKKYLNLDYIAKNSTIITVCGEKTEKSKRYKLVSNKFTRTIAIPEHLVSWNFPQILHLRKEVDWCIKVLKTFLLMKRDLELLLEYERISVLVGKPKKKVLFLFKASINDTKPKLLSTTHFHLPSGKHLRTKIRPQGTTITVWPIVLKDRVMFKLTGKESKLSKARKASSMYLTYLRNIYRVVGCQSQTQLT